MNADLASDTPTTMHPMPHPKGGCHCSNRINKNHSSFIKKRKTGGDGFRASLPTSSTPPGCAMRFQSLPFTHPLFDVRHSPLFLFFFILFFCIFFSAMQYFQSKQHPFKKSTAKMRWKWKKKRTRRLQRKRRKMRARAK